MRFFFTFLAGAIVGVIISALETIKEFDAVGIQCIRECTIDTHNCYSNWYEIVWKEAK